MRRGSISWRRWGERDRGVTRGFDATGNCVLDAEFLPRTGPWWKGMGKRESVILTRRRGDAERNAEKRRSQREDERGDSGGWWPSVRSGWVSGEEQRG